MSYEKSLSCSKSRRFLVTIIVGFGLLFGSMSTYAQTSSDIPAYELREALLDYISALQGCGVTDSNGALQNQIRGLDDEQLAAFAASIPDWAALSKSLSDVTVSCGDSSSITPLSSPFGELSSAQALTSSSFTPDYPSGSKYRNFVATLPGLGLLNNGYDNRTDANNFGDAWIVLEAFTVAGIILDTACNATPSPFEPATCIPAGVAHGVAFATQITIDQAAYQDGLIDNAEIEAAYENSKLLLDNTVDISSDLATHGTAISTQINQHDTSISYQVDQHDIAISTQVDQHNVAISTQVDQHDIAISTQVDQHDADIKAKLALLNGKVDVMMARQLEIIRLLNTPQGQRTTDVSACGDAPCDWPAE